MIFARIASCILPFDGTRKLLLVCFAGCLLSLPAQSQNCASNLLELVRKGDAEEAAGRENFGTPEGAASYKAAFGLFSDALSLDCASLQTDSLLGEINYKAGRCLLGTEGMAERDACIPFFRRAAQHYEAATSMQGRVYSCYTNMGRAFRELNDYRAAEVMFRQGNKELSQSRSDTTRRGILLLGDFFREWGELQSQQDKLFEAAGKFERAWNLYTLNDEVQYLISTGLSLGNVLRKMNRPKESLKWLESVKALVLSHPEFAFYISDYQLNAGLAYKRLNEMDTSIYYFNAAGKDPYYEADALNNLGIVQRRQDNYTAALANLQAAARLTKPRNFRDKTARLAYAAPLENIGDTYRDSTALDSALTYYQSSMEMLIPGFQSADIHTLPDLNRMQPIGSRKQLINLLSAKAATLHTRYLRDRDEQDLTAAAATFDLAIELIDRFRREFQAKESRLFLMEEAFSTYEGAIAVALDRQQPERAFQLAEKAKGSMLFAAIQDNEAREYANIAPDLLEEEYRLKQQIAQVEYKLTGMPVEDPGSVALFVELNDLEESLDVLIRKMETSSKAYYDLKYETREVEVAKLRQLLPPNTSLLEYFAGEQLWYIFAVNKAGVKVFTANRDTTAVNAYLRLLPQTGNLSQADMARFRTLGHELFQQLMGDAAPDLGEEVIVVPDGELNYLSFETLLTREPAANAFLKDYPYLLRDKALSYSFSARLWQHAVQQENQTELYQRNFIAFAPEFAPLTRNQLPARDQALLDLSFFSDRAEPDENRSWSDLEYSSREVQKVRELLGGIIYPNEPLRALLGRFVNESESYRFVHLATHGIFNKQNGKYSYLVFQPVNDSIDNERLYLADLYRIHLNAEMVVLSACETQVGEWHPGEGIASLAQGFAYAGARSIVATLWSVPNQSTAELTPLFYSYLRKGHSKAQALRLAKLDMLAMGLKYAAPYYWAAPVVIGDTRPVSFSGWLRYLGLGLLLLLIVIGLFLYVYRKKNKQTASKLST